MDVKYIKIYGMPRSGTNYLKKLVETNFLARILVHVGRGKHMPPKKIGVREIRNVKKFGKEKLQDQNEIQSICQYLESDVIYSLIIMKNPYSWLVSYKNYINRNSNPNIPQILHIDKSEDDLKKAVKWWNDIGSKYLEFVREHGDISILVRYEELVDDYKIVLDNIGSTFNLTSREKQLVNIDSVIGPGFKNTRKQFDAGKYQSARYLKEFSADQIKLINQELDKKVMEQFEYPFYA